MSTRTRTVYSPVVFLGKLGLDVVRGNAGTIIASVPLPGYSTGYKENATIIKVLIHYFLFFIFFKYYCALCCCNVVYVLVVLLSVTKLSSSKKNNRAPGGVVVTIRFFAECSG